MTGGSLPAMTFKRLMDYAEQGIEHRTIPGIDATAPVAQTKAKPAEDESADALPALVRPRMLSSEVSRIIRDLGSRMEKAPAVVVPAATLPGRVAGLEDTPLIGTQP